MTYDLTAPDTSLHPKLTSDFDVEKRLAYHQAGHAVAICFGNKLRNQPEVYFQISIKDQSAGQDESHPLSPPSTYQLEGGRLVQSLPFCFDEATRFYSDSERAEYVRAFETDIINLLVGPVAEAKYVACRDDEIFSRNLIGVDSLRFYGGTDDLKLVTEYLASYIPRPQERGSKLKELYHAAYRFVDKRNNWQAISNVAGLILSGTKTCVNCEDVMNCLNCGCA